MDIGKSNRVTGNSSSGGIRYVLGQSSLGPFLVASTDLGVVSILLGDDEPSLVDSLTTRFPGAALSVSAGDVDGAAAAVSAFVENPARGLDLRLDIGGTPFQRLVWSALREIPLGETVSYAEIARRVGRPRAIRAVAGACATNDIALAVPCHRVIRGDGSLSGYAWGVSLKKALLEREANARAE